MNPDTVLNLFDYEEEENYEESRCSELAKELELFDLQDRLPSPVESEEIYSTVRIQLVPPGIAFFKNNIHSLYTEDTLLWPFTCSFDPYLSLIEPSVIKEYIKKRYFMREVYSTDRLIKYLFHTICCTTDEELCHAACDTLTYLITTYESVSEITKEFCLALVNLGADDNILKVGMSGYMSPVIPKHCDAPQGTQVITTQLRKVLMMVLQFLSLCLANHKKYVDQDPEELILILIAIGLDPKVINLGLDEHIATCISHCLTLYSTDEDLCKNLNMLVEDVLQYCGGDVLSVVHLCQRYISVYHRGKILQTSLTFHQLQIHVGLPGEDFIDDIQVKHVLELLTRCFDTQGGELSNDVFYYIIKLLDLCFHGDFLFQLCDKGDLSKVCDLMKQRIRKLQKSPGDDYATLVTWYLEHVTKKWRSHIEEQVVEQEGAEQPSSEADMQNLSEKVDVEQMCRGLRDCMASSVITTQIENKRT